MATYWDPELGRGGGGAEPQQLELNGFTLSLVPDGGSVQLPVGVVSSIGPSLILSTLRARDSIVVGPSSNVTITSTGQINANIMAPQLLNALAVNATNGTITSISSVNTQATNLRFTNGSGTLLQTQNTSSLAINASSITFGNRYKTTLSEDQDAFFQTKITGNDINMYVNLSQYGPGQNINGRFFNGENYNATSSIQATNFVRVSNPASNGIINLNEHILSNTANNLTYDDKPIQTGQRGDVAQWAQFPANTTVNANGNDVRNVNGLYANGIDVGGATLNNIANIVTNTQTGSVNILTKAGTNTVFAPGNFNVGFSGGNPLSTQPNINLKGNAVNIAAGDLISPAYASGRTINIDAYAGTSAQLLPPFANANSYINITSHGNSVGPIPVFGKGAGNITLTAFNAYNGLVPDPFTPGKITLDASVVNIGNPTYTGLGTTAIVNVQGAIVQTIAGLQLAGDPSIPSYQIRSAGGVTIYNDPTGFSNRDSRLYVRDIFGHSNFVSDFGPPALTLDGLDGGLTLNNFTVANGQGDGADMNNIATMTGAYPTNVQNQINALQNTVANISTTGGASNIAQWSAFPGLSTVVANRDLNFTGTTASISSLAGVQFNNTAGSLTNTYQKRVYLDGRNATTGSTMMYFDASAVSFINPGSLAYNNIRGNGIFFGPSNFLGVSSGQLQFNGQSLVSTTGGGGGSVGPNPLVSTLTVNQGGFVRLRSAVTSNTSLQFDKDLSGNQKTLMNMYYNEGDGNALQLCLENQGNIFDNFNVGKQFFWGNQAQGGATTNYTLVGGNYITGNPVLALSNVSSINGLPISTFTGGAGPSTIQNWSFFPVTSNSIQFGNQTAWIKGGGNALFTTPDGSNTIPVTAKALTVFDPDNIGVIRNIGLDSNGILTASRTNTHPSDFKVSSLYLNENPLTTDGVDLFLNGTNIGSGNTAQWANYPATSTIQGANLQLSNLNASLTMFAPLGGVTDPRSTSLFVNPFQIQMINKNPVNRNLFAMTNGSNNFSIQNDTAGCVMRTDGVLQNGDPSKITILSDVEMGFSNKFTSRSTITNGLVISSMMINGNNILTASGGSLLFNGSVVNSSNSIQTWATFPATSNVAMNSNSIFGVSNIQSFNYTNTTNPGFVMSQTGGGSYVFNGSVGVSCRNTFPTPLLINHSFLGVNGNISLQNDNGGSNYVVSPFGMAYQPPGIGNWFVTNVSTGTSRLTINQYNTSNLISTGTVYDTTFNPIPTFPIVYCGPQNAGINFNLPAPAGFSQVNIITPLGTFIPTTNQGIVSFSVVVPASYASSPPYIGVGPVGNFNASNSYMSYIRTRDPSVGGYFDRYSLTCDFTGFVGSPYNFRIQGLYAGLFVFQDCYYKPLPN